MTWTSTPFSWLTGSASQTIPFISSMSTATKNIAFVGPAVAETGKAIVNHLKTGQYTELLASIYPEVEEDVKIGTVPVKAFIAPGNEASRRLFQQTVLEESSSYHGIVYLTHPDFESLATAKSELATLLSTGPPLTVLVLAIVEDVKPSEEALAAQIGLLEYPHKYIKLAVATLPLATESAGFEWLAERLTAED